MPQKLLRLIRKLIDFILDESPGEKISQQNVIAVEGDVYVTVIGDNKHKPNLMLPKTKSNVKRFPKNSRKSVINY